MVFRPDQMVFQDVFRDEALHRHQDPNRYLAEVEQRTPSCSDDPFMWRRSSRKLHNKRDRKQCEPDQEGPESKLFRRIQTIQCDATTQEPDRG